MAWVFLGLAEALMGNQQDAVSRPQCALRFLPGWERLLIVRSTDLSGSGRSLRRPMGAVGVSGYWASEVLSYRRERRGAG
jgi:hypothetical protein